MKAALYIRVSTTSQDAANQIPDLERFVKAHGWEVVETYSDTISGRKDSRPALTRLMADAAARRFDVVLVWALDRFGRSVQQLATNINSLDSAGVRFIAVRQNLDTDKANPASRLMLNILAAIAEFEAAMIRERSLEGTKRYRRDLESGKATVPIGRPARVFDRQQARAMREEGKTLQAIADALGLNLATVHACVRDIGKVGTCEPSRTS